MSGPRALAGTTGRAAARRRHDDDRLLIVAVSARMIAQLAVGAGYRVLCYDRFGDHDLRALGPVVSLAHDLPGPDRLERLVEHALRHARDCTAVVCGGGLENRPDLVARLAAGRELLGSTPAAIEAVRDPDRLRAALDAAGVAMPVTLRVGQPLPTSGSWLRKPLRGGGGRGVRRWRGGRLRPSELLQEHRRGMPCSAVVAADGHRAHLLGLTEQLVGEPRLGARGFTWCGNVSPPRLPPIEQAALRDRLQHAADAVVETFALRGLLGIDAVWDGDDAWVLEVNPRPPAGLEPVDMVRGGGTFALHIEGARGPIGNIDRCELGAAARIVLYAPVDTAAPRPELWGPDVRDVPPEGEPLAIRQPVCSIVSAGAASGPVLEGLLRRAEGFAARMTETVHRHVPEPTA